VIQINGRKRGLINSQKNISETELFNIVKNENLIDKYLKDKSIKKTIFVKNRLMNLIIL
jgi:leucyl-tRNA synthetase